MTELDHSNVITFLFTLFLSFIDILNQVEFWGLSLWMWIVGFMFTGIMISVFWKGARG